MIGMVSSRVQRVLDKSYLTASLFSTLDPRSLLIATPTTSKALMDPVVKGIEPVQGGTDEDARSVDEDETFQKDWSEDEERRAKRKLV